MNQDPILFVAHEATRTGSPQVLLELLAYAVPRLPRPVAVRLLSGGPLGPLLASCATVADSSADPAAVVVNGVLAAGELATVGESVPSLVYVHEEGEALEVLDEPVVDALVQRSDRVLCVSPRSRQGLLDLGVPADRIGLLRPVVVGGSGSGAPPGSEARARCGAAGSTALVLGCGEAGWRKGTDLFLQVAARVGRDSNCAFAWVGRRRRGFSRVLEHDMEVLGLSDRMVWVDEVEDPSPFLAAADLLLMTSREDPQPLVPLEAALLGTPTVGFELGGLAEYAERGAVRVARYPDVAATAAEVEALLADPRGASSLAAAAATIVEEERSVEVLGAAFVAELLALLAAGGDAGEGLLA